LREDRINTAAIDHDALRSEGAKLSATTLSVNASLFLHEIMQRTRLANKSFLQIPT
jgi:hypothetical protein